MTEQRNDAVSLAGALKNAALAYGPNGSGGMRIVADFTSPDEALPLFEILSDAADEDAPECFQCGEVYGENPQCPVHGRNTTAWEHCRIGSCQRHQNCMYHPCRSSNAISPSPAPSPLGNQAIWDALRNFTLEDGRTLDSLFVKGNDKINFCCRVAALSTEAGKERIEQMARIIEPTRWEYRDSCLSRREEWEKGYAVVWPALTFEQWASRGIHESMEKARAIAALFKPTPVEDREINTKPVVDHESGFGVTQTATSVVSEADVRHLAFSDDVSPADPSRQVDGDDEGKGQ